MNAKYLATVKCYEARDRLRATQEAVWSLYELEVLPCLQPELEALLKTLAAHGRQLAEYTQTLKGGRVRRNPSWRSPRKLLEDQLADVETGIRYHERMNPEGFLLKALEQRKKQIEHDLERVKWHESLEVQHGSG